MSGDGPTDWETMEALEPHAGDQLERVMARYARVRLDASPAEVRRARSTVMEAAWRARLDATPAPQRRRHPFSGWSARRIGLAASAAVLAGLCIGSSVFAASRAGGPLYDARIAFEDATLPADPAARLQTQIANTQTRLAEAYDAEARGDDRALAAALAAYEADATSLATTTGPDTQQALMAAEQHRDVLLNLIQRAPAAALPGLNQALESSDKAIEQLTAAGANGNGGDNGAGGNGGGAGGNGASPAPSHQPATTAAPTPKPTAQPKPAATPTPTPKPKHTPNPGNGGPNATTAPQPSKAPGQP